MGRSSLYTDNGDATAVANTFTHDGYGSVNTIKNNRTKRQMQMCL